MSTDSEPYLERAPRLWSDPVIRGHNLSLWQIDSPLNTLDEKHCTKFAEHRRSQSGDRCCYNSDRPDAHIFLTIIYAYFVPKPFKSGWSDICNWLSNKNRTDLRHRIYHFPSWFKDTRGRRCFQTIIRQAAALVSCSLQLTEKTRWSLVYRIALFE